MTSYLVLGLTGRDAMSSPQQQTGLELFHLGHKEEKPHLLLLGRTGIVAMPSLGVKDVKAVHSLFFLDL